MNDRDLNRRVRLDRELTFGEKKALLIGFFEGKQKDTNADSKTIDMAKKERPRVDIAWLIDWAERENAIQTKE